MTATAEPPVPAVETSSHPPPTRSRGEGVPYLAPGEGVELLGPIRGSGYRDGVALVRRADGQMVQLGGSTVSNLADNLQLFGVGGKTNYFAITYQIFGDIVKSQYPSLLPSYPPVAQVVDMSYLKSLQGSK